MASSGYTYFYHGSFSQYAKSSFTLDFEGTDYNYPTAEHAMHHHKALLMGDDKVAEMILKSKSPGEAKALGRKCKFKPALWNKNKIN